MEKTTTVETEKIYCSHCKSEIIKECETRFEGTILCLECYAKLTVQCDSCGTRIYKTAVVHITDADDEKNYCSNCTAVCDLCDDTVLRENTESDKNNTYCNTCYDAHYSNCDHCRRIFERDEMSIAGGNFVCNDCLIENYTQCHKCEEWFENDEIITSEISGDTYCDECYSDEFTRCYNCDREIRQRDANHNENDGETYCSDCYCEDTSSSRIHDAGYKPQYKNVYDENDEGDKLLLGIELELDNVKCDKCDLAEEIENENFYFKEDGSLSCGFEIVSMPHTITALKNSALKKMCITASGKSESHTAETCGLHIHIGIEHGTNMREEMERRLTNFVFINWKLIVKISRRKKSQLERWSNKYNNVVFPESDDLKNGIKSSKYFAVNCLHEETIELRFFRGTLNYETVIASIEFIHALYNFLLLHDSTTFSDLITYIKSCGVKYESVLKYLETKKVI